MNFWSKKLPTYFYLIIKFFTFFLKSYSCNSSTFISQFHFKIYPCPRGRVAPCFHFTFGCNTGSNCPVLQIRIDLNNRKYPSTIIHRAKRGVQRRIIIYLKNSVSHVPVKNSFSKNIIHYLLAIYRSSLTMLAIHKKKRRLNEQRISYQV